MRERSSSRKEIKWCIHYFYHFILFRSVSIIASKRILWDPEDIIEETNPKHFPPISIFKPVQKDVERIRKSESTKFRTTNTLSLNGTIVLDIYVSETFEEKNNPPNISSGGLLAKAFSSKRTVTRDRIIERWTIKKTQKERKGYENAKTVTKSSILMRALYSYLLLLPGYKLYRGNLRNRIGREKFLMKYRLYDVSDAGKYKYVSESELCHKRNFGKIKTELFTVEIGVEWTSKLSWSKGIKEGKLVDSKIIEKNFLEKNLKEKNLKKKKKKSPIYRVDSSGVDEKDEIELQKRLDEIFKKDGIGRSKPREIKQRPVFGNNRPLFDRNKVRVGGGSVGSGARTSSYSKQSISYGGSPPFGGFGTSLDADKTPSFYESSSLERSPPFGIIKPSTSENKRLSFSPFDSPPLNSYNSSTYRSSNDQTSSSSSVSDENYENKKKKFLKTKKIEKISIEKKKSVDFSVNNVDSSTESIEKSLEMKFDFPPPFLDYKFKDLSVNELQRSTKSTPSTPKSNSLDFGKIQDDDSALAFVDENMNLENEDLTHEEEVGLLLNNIEKAPNLTAFYNGKTGEVKTEKLINVLEKLNKLQRMKNEILSLDL